MKKKKGHKIKIYMKKGGDDIHTYNKKGMFIKEVLK
jgi:hypothetical protein